MTTFNAARARAKRPCPLWVDAFQRDTQHLQADEVGAYMLILMAMWTRETCDFPDDETRLARVSRVSARLWRSRIGPVIMPFFSAENGAVISKRLKQEASYTERHVTQQSDRKASEKSGKSLNYNEPHQTADISTDEPWNHPTQLPNYPTVGRKRETNVSLVHPACFSAKDFADFWAAYPHRNGKKKNRQGSEAAFARAIKSGADVAEIAAGVDAMRRDPDVMRGYARDPTTWLNQRGWTDEIPETKGGFIGRPSPSQQLPNGPANRPDPALEQILRLTGLGPASGNGRH